MDAVEQELRKMAEDPDTPAHLKLGALKQLVALRTAGAGTESSSASSRRGRTVCPTTRSPSSSPAS